ncbi:unnamed protein product [Caenorhabditis angaria]|uniref:Neurotransmitter-gated ion-channel ligand-binding domain-containing protein n=1 Tax=Caenorhabditis angaria TaxID=860376 RepID=A0A9P1J0H5_9PELO|nr:unnamed protein product [Caenorhabditis angaria]
MRFILLFALIVRICGYFQDGASYEDIYYDYLHTQQNLTEYLFDGYDPTVSPVFTRGISDTVITFKNSNYSNKWNYTVFLYYLKLIDIDEPAEKVEFCLEIMEVWFDARLTWNATLYNNISTVYVREDKIWSPTMSAFGVNDVQDFRDQDFRQASISNSGEVYTYMPIRISVNCPLNMRMFPFDHQTCYIRLCLPMFYSREISIHVQFYDAILQPSQIAAMGNSEWRVINLTGKIDVLKYDEQSSDLEICIFEITMKRNPMFYFYMIIFPCYIINAVSLFAIFLKDTDKMSKLNVGITTIMTQTFILGFMADSIPKTGVIPLLGIHILINLGIMIVAIAFVAVRGKIQKFKDTVCETMGTNYSRFVLTAATKEVSQTSAKDANILPISHKHYKSKEHYAVTSL